MVDEPNATQTAPEKGRLLFRLFKGFLYGAVIGLIFGTSIYMLAKAVNSISTLSFNPDLWPALIFGASVTAGTAVEYSHWLEEKKGQSVLFRIIKGFIYGNVIGLIFGSAIYLLAAAVNGVSTLPYSPTVFPALIYGASVVAGTAVEYARWLDNMGSS